VCRMKVMQAIWELHVINSDSVLQFQFKFISLVKHIGLPQLMLVEKCDFMIVLSAVNLHLP